MRGLSIPRPAARDAAAAAVFVALYLTTRWFALGHGWYPSSDVLYKYQVAAIWTVIVLLTREFWPISTLLAVVVLFPSSYGADGLRTEFHLLPIILAAYTVAAKGRLPVVLTLLLAEFGVVRTLFSPSSAMQLLSDKESIWWWGPSRIALVLVFSAAVVLLGRASYRQQQATLELRRRHSELERLRGVETEQLVLAERTRIARELHDVVAHHITAMVIRAQAAERVSGSRPGETLAAVRWIAANGQQTLGAMRQVVRVLRSTEAGGSLSPQATLEEELPQIATRMRAVGLPVELRIPEVVPMLPPSVELAVVRIVQEALTNTLTHSGASRALVELTLVGTGEQIRVDIHDDGASAGDQQAQPVLRLANEPGGNGLVGIRERAASCGGELSIGVSPLGGWQVTVVLAVSSARVRRVS